VARHVGGERGGCVLSHAIHNHDLLTWMTGPLVELRAMATTRVNDVRPRTVPPPSAAPPTARW
jgi:predicted dehydrogenase